MIALIGLIGYCHIIIGALHQCITWSTVHWHHPLCCYDVILWCDIASWFGPLICALDYSLNCADQYRDFHKTASNILCWPLPIAISWFNLDHWSVWSNEFGAMMFEPLIALFSAILSLFPLGIVLLIVNIHEDLEVLGSILDQPKCQIYKKTIFSMNFCCSASHSEPQACWLGLLDCLSTKRMLPRSSLFRYPKSFE